MALNKKILFLLVGACLLISAIIVLCVVFLTKQKDPEDTHVLLESQEWIHGAYDCSTQSDPLIQLVQYDRNTWIFRQNKCVHYEAPFMYLFVGKQKALLIDTGATEDERMMPLYQMVNDLLKSRGTNENPLQLIVAHSHSHGDHYAGDGQFNGKPNVSVIGLEVEDVKTFFNLNQWPDGESNLDLGDRTIKIFPIPGHQVASLAFYDSDSKLLLTGDTFYPGRLYVFDWIAFKDSIMKLYSFTGRYDVTYIVGTHIEMTVLPGVDYPIGSDYQPYEQKLPLTVEELALLNNSLQSLADPPAEPVKFDKFIVVPRM